MCKGRINRAEQTNKLPVIGKIKIGEKSEKGFPKSLDYFKPFGKYEKLFYDVFPDKPNIIPIIFISDNTAEVCNERFELRNSKGDLYATSDGEVFEIYDDKEKVYKTFFKADHPEIWEKTELKINSKWKTVLTLRFIIPQIKGILGLWQLETKGEKSSIDQIRDTFDFVQSSAGTVTRIMFDLAVIKHKSQKPDNPSSYPVLSLIPNVSESNLQLLKEYSESGKLSNIGYLNDSKILELQENKPKQILHHDELKEVTSKEYHLQKSTDKEIENLFP